MIVRMRTMQPWKHFCTITRHRHEVIRNCFHAGILWQGLRHDLSKYSPTEFMQGARYYQGDRSPNAEERERNGYSIAWLHHQGRNKHHFEYWQDYDPKTRFKEPVKMPVKYVKEMFCDRVAAGKIYYGKNYKEDMPLAYFEKGKYCRMIHPETSDLIEKLLRMLKEKGEKETFRYIRNLKKY